LQPAEAAGLLAGVTGLGLTSDVATTGITNVVLALKGKNEAGRKILDRLGIDRESNLFDQLDQLGAAIAAGQLEKFQLETIFGREGLSVGEQLADPAKRGLI